MENDPRPSRIRRSVTCSREGRALEFVRILPLFEADSKFMFCSDAWIPGKEGPLHLAMAPLSRYDFHPPPENASSSLDAMGFATGSIFEKRGSETRDAKEFRAVHSNLRNFAFQPRRMVQADQFRPFAADFRGVLRLSCQCFPSPRGECPNLVLQSKVSGVLRQGD